MRVLKIHVFSIWQTLGIYIYIYIHQFIFSWKEPKKFFDKFCDATENGGEVYVKINHEKLIDELEKRHKKVLKVIDENKYLSDKGKGTVTMWIVPPFKHFL